MATPTQRPTRLCLIIAALLVACVTAVVAAAGTPLRLSNQRELFLDDVVLETLHGVNVRLKFVDRDADPYSFGVFSK